MKLIEAINTWQGEGPDSGTYCTLLRFKRCNLVENKTPCPWCDTIKKMSTLEEKDYDIEDLRTMIYSSNGLIVTGGEPGLYLDELNYLFKEVINPAAYMYRKVNIETNGYNINKLGDLLESTISSAKIIYSPKLHVSGELQNMLQVATSLIEGDFCQNICFKIVVDNDPNTLLAIKTLRSILGRFAKDLIWLMPQGKDKNEVLANSKMVLRLCRELQVNFSGRGHLVYGFE